MCSCAQSLREVLAPPDAGNPDQTAALDRAQVGGTNGRYRAHHRENQLRARSSGAAQSGCSHAERNVQALRI